MVMSLGQERRNRFHFSQAFSLLSGWTKEERLGFPKICRGKAGVYLTEIHKVTKKMEEY